MELQRRERECCIDERPELRNDGRMAPVSTLQNSRVWRTPGGTFELRQPSESLALTKVAGHIDEELGRIIAEAHFAMLTKTAGVHTFHDWFEASGYDSGARKTLTNMVLQLRPKLGSVHILVSSRILSMGISVANVVLGGFIRSYSERQKFEAAYEQQRTKAA